MLLEYAVEPKAIGSNWQDFRYLIEKFGFDRGRLISQFPKAWLREVYEASAGLKPMERKRVEERLIKAKSSLIRSGRSYDPGLGGWLQNAISQHAHSPFHAIVAENNPAGSASVIATADMDDLHPLMVSPHTWEVRRTGAALANAIAPMLKSARTLLFVDRFFDVGRQSYRQTLKACLDVVHLSGVKGAQCEIHFCDDRDRPTFEEQERDAPRWLRGVIPEGMTVLLYAWNEKSRGEDFHARYLLSDVGGVSVEAGFSAEGDHQNVQLGLLTNDLCERKRNALAPDSNVYDLAQPVLKISAAGNVTRLPNPEQNARRS